jgi:cardiolipin synthase
MEMLQNLLSSYIAAAIAYLVLTVAASVHILLNKKNVYSSIGWLAVVWMSPVFGALAYFLLGINRIHRKASILKDESSKKLQRKHYNFKVPEAAPAQMRRILEVLKIGINITNEKMLKGNSVKPLINGDAAYPEMLAAIKSAQKQVFISSYIFDYDSVGILFIEAIKQAAARGAEIYILFDGFGSWGHISKFKKALARQRGVNIAVFLPPLKNLSFINLRNHRKIITVDGKTAFFGGMNLSADNLLKTASNPVADITFKIEGSVVSQISKTFADDWYFATKQTVLPVTQASDIKEDNFARLILDGPQGAESMLELILLAAINFARKSVDIITPYFLPRESVFNALEIAAMKGVKVNIILPEISNHIIFNWAHESIFYRLLRRGVNIYKSPPPFDHSKVLTIDGVWSFIGSSNWDERSFRLNFEANMEILDLKFATMLKSYARTKRKKSKKLDIAAYENMPKILKLRNNFARLFTPYF